MNSFIRHKPFFQTKIIARYLCVSYYRQNLSNKPHPKTLNSKEIRKLFLNYFIKSKNHTYIQSSPVFLNNDPSLLFVNAGMNQFRSLLLDKTYPGHPFHHLKRAANSQKCVRLSGKHNDLNEVGVDVYHHTFFEMLGNWSFGDYSKLDTCKMAWELLTEVYGLNPQNLYVTYFEGDETLGLPADEECKQNWLEVGVHPDHIFPFGAKDNFWEMGDSGPCGPCTEIHYDFNSAGHVEVSQKINRGSPDVMEIWNLVFIQCKREKDGVLKTIPTLNIDTGMGFERLCAVLQGTNSNYDTDIFSPIFQAIESNFKVRPYSGRTGSADIDGFDTAYRIVADHARMFSVAIADGLFPDSCDAGHVLRKIIRRAAYTANRTMKTKPGVLSSLVPHVAKTLDFFPEIEKNIDEIEYIINDEEKVFHHTINKGRKARNKMISNNSENVLEGQHVWELHKVHGLELNIIQDIASEKNLSIDWESYEKVKDEKLFISKKKQEKEMSFFSTIINQLKDFKIPLTNDSYKYKYSTSKEDPGVEDIRTNLLAIFKKTNLVNEAEKGERCIIVTDNTNFYSEAGGQIASIGKIFSKDFVFKVENVTSSEGYVLHHGIVEEGRVQKCEVQMTVQKDHHLSCSQNHTATHILNAALRKVLPYTSQRSSYVSPNYLRFGFSAKSPLSIEELEKIETYTNDIIQKSLPVSRKEMLFEELLNIPNVILLHGEEYPENVIVIAIRNGDSDISSIEPCCGIHVHNTVDIESFCITPSKSSIGSTKYISAVTGKQANVIRKNGKLIQDKVQNLEKRVNEAVNDIKITPDSLQLLLKEVKGTIGECQSKTDAPLLVLKKCDEVLRELKVKLADLINILTQHNAFDSPGFICDPPVSSSVINYLKRDNISPTDDGFKYQYHNQGVKPIKANILAIVRDNDLVAGVERGLKCQIVLDKTNFYASDDDQASDNGILSCEDFIFRIDNVFKVNGFVFHEGVVEKGYASVKQNIDLFINQQHRFACSRNHTALHILNSVMKQELPYFFPVSASAGALELRLTFTSTNLVTDEELEIIEHKVNEFIKAGLEVNKRESDPDAVEDIPMYKSALLKQKEIETLPFIAINEGKKLNLPKSIEPCHGTHVDFTSDIGSFIIISQTVKDKERIIRAVTGEQAALVKKEGLEYDKQLSELEEYVLRQIELFKSDHLLLWDCLKKVKEAKGYHKTELPLLLFRSHQNQLTELTEKLNDATKDFVQKGFADVKSEMNTVLEANSCNPFIVHELKSLGDGKKIANYAIENSSNKPALYFVRDGQTSFICSCSVPKSFVTSNFSALLWINPVASFLNGRARTLAKDPEMFYSVVTDKVDKIGKALHIAFEYASAHIKQ